MHPLPEPAIPVAPKTPAWWNSEQGLRTRGTRFLLLAVCGAAIFSTALVQVLAGILAAMFLWSRATGSQGRLHWTPLHTPFAVFLAGRVLSIAFSQDVSRSMSALSIEYVYYLLFFIAAEIMAEDPVGGSRDMTVVLVWSATVAAVFGSILVLFELTWRAQSTTAGAYTLGGFLCFVLPLVLFSPRPAFIRFSFFRWVQVFLICVGIVLTLDRLHWIGMAGILLLAGILIYRRILIAAVVIGALLYVVFPSVNYRVTELFHLSQNMAGRDVLWQGAAMLIDKHPLVGFGPRTFPEIFPLFDKMPIRGVGSWHNDYLQVYMENGLLGLLPMTWLVIAIVKNGWQSLRLTKATDEIHQTLLAVLLSLGIMLVIGGMLDTIIGIPFRIVLGAFAQLIVTVRSRETSSDARVSPARDRRDVIPLSSDYRGANED